MFLAQISKKCSATNLLESLADGIHGRFEYLQEFGSQDATWGIPRIGGCSQAHACMLISPQCDKPRAASTINQSKVSIGIWARDKLGQAAHEPNEYVENCMHNSGNYIIRIFDTRMHMYTNNI